MRVDDYRQPECGVELQLVADLADFARDRLVILKTQHYLTEWLSAERSRQPDVPQAVPAFVLLLHLPCPAPAVAQALAFGCKLLPKPFTAHMMVCRERRLNDVPNSQDSSDRR